jgi:hypothetical protein
MQIKEPCVDLVRKPEEAKSKTDSPEKGQEKNATKSQLNFINCKEADL